jgi:hypothetical protein
MQQIPPVVKTPQNPLSKYFRQPAIYLKLPSGGKYWDEGSLDMPITGDIPVYPMTARDEITLRTPDALMNGTSVVEVVQSCCPSIKNAWKMPSIDVDAVLIAIRIASYGANMEVDTNCPECKTENNNQLDLTYILGNIKPPSYVDPVDVDQLRIKLKPQEFIGINRQNIISYEEQRMVQALADIDSDTEAKASILSQSMSKLVDVGLDVVTASTEYIELEDGTQVTQQTYIREFYQHANGAVIRKIQDTLAKRNAEAAIKNQKVKCSNCELEYQVPLAFDYSNFFAQGS